MVRINITVSDGTLKNGTAVQKLLLFATRAPEGELRDRASKSATVLMTHAISSPKSYYQVQKLVLELGGRKDEGSMSGMCAAVDLLECAPTTEDGIEQLEKLKRTGLRGEKINLLIKDACSGDTERAYETIRWNLVRFEMKQLRKDGTVMDIKRQVRGIPVPVQ